MIALAVVSYVLLTVAFVFADSYPGPRLVLTIGWTATTCFAAGLGLWLAAGGAM